MYSIYIGMQAYEPLEYQNKCPKEGSSFQDVDYFSEGKFPLNLKQIYVENGISDIMA